MSLFFIDCEAPFGCGGPATGDMTEFGAVAFHDLESWESGHRDTFHGANHLSGTFEKFEKWIAAVNRDGITNRPTMISDNPAYDWQWINFYFWKYFGANPLGFSARRIGDFYAGLVGNFRKANDWKRLRETKHDHTPVNDAMGNAEAFVAMLRGAQKNIAKKAHAVAEKMCGCDPTYCPCDGLHSKEAVEAEIIRQFS